MPIFAEHRVYQQLVTQPGKLSSRVPATLTHRAQATGSGLQALVSAGSAAARALAPVPMRVVPVERGGGRAELLFCGEVGRAGEEYGRLLVAAGYGAQTARAMAQSMGLPARLDQSPGAEPVEYLCRLVIGEAA